MAGGRRSGGAAALCYRYHGEVALKAENKALLDEAENITA